MPKGIMGPIASADFNFAVKMENGQVVLVSRAGGPNRVCESIAEAIQVTGDDQVGRRPMPTTKEATHDGTQEWADLPYQQMLALSRKTYDSPPPG